MNVRNLVTVAAAARHVGLAYKTLYTALNRGDLKSYATRCGLRLVTVAEVERFAANRPQRGRKRGVA